MGILLNFIIPEGHLLEMIPLPVVHRQSEKYEILTDTVHRLDHAQRLENELLLSLMRVSS